MAESETLSLSPCPSSSSGPTPTLSQEQREQIERNKELARQKLKKKAAEKELEVLIDYESDIRKEQEAVDDESVGAGGFGGFAYREEPPQKRSKRMTEGESALMKDMRNLVNEGSVVRIHGTKVVDTGGGFLIEEKDLLEEEEEEKVLKVHPAPLVPTDAANCEECGRPFQDSYLLHTFDHPVCDGCKDTEEKHQLVTKTDCKNEYLLKDVDLDKREPPLKYVTRPNPHNSRWGDMKLYLRPQVEKRAIEVWGSLEKIEEQLEQREENRAKTKIKKYNKKMGALRMSARSSLYTRDLGPHEHSWGPDECVDEEEDLYKHKCTECGQEETFEKM